MVNRRRFGRYGLRPDLRCLLSLTLLALAALVQDPTRELAAATLTAEVDRRQLYVHEPLLFTLRLTDSDTRLRAEGLDPNVDLSRLTRDFELGVPRSSHRYNIHRNRGRSTSELQVLLFPKREGELEIPAFTVEGLHTAPIPIRVLPAPPDPAPEVFARSGATKRTVWVGERTVAYLDLYYRVALRNARLGGSLDTEPKRLRLRPLPDEERRETHAGLEYRVTRTAWSITPVTAQPITLLFPDVWVETEAGKKIRLPFTDDRLEVRPLPPGIPPDLLVGRPRLSQALSSGTATVHTPLTWTITLEAAVDLLALPESLALAETPGIKLYSNRPQRQWRPSPDPETGTPLATARYDITVIPLRAGELALPAPVIPYFDPQTRRLERATLPPLTLTVAAPSTPAVPPDAVEEERTPDNLAQDRDGKGTEERGGDTTEDRRDELWAGLAALFALLWLATLWLWWRARRQRPSHGAGDPTPPWNTDPHPAGDGSPYARRLCVALGSSTLETGLQRWEARHGPDPALRRLVAQVQSFHYGPRKEEMDATAIEAGLQDLERRIQNRTEKETRHPASEEAASDPWRPDHFGRRASPPRD